MFHLTVAVFVQRNRDAPAVRASEEHLVRERLHRKRILQSAAHGHEAPPRAYPYETVL